MENARSPKVLLIDDDPAILDVVSRLLAVDNVSVDCESSAKNALQRMAGTAYDAVLCDMRMPEMSGQQIYERVQSDFPALRGRFVLMTGDVASEQTWDLIERTHVHYVVKPIDFTQLLETLREVTNGAISIHVDNKRRHDRVPLKASAQIHCDTLPDMQPEIVEVENASDDGLYFHSSRLYRVGMDIIVRFPEDDMREQHAFVARVDELPGGQLGVAITLRKPDSANPGKRYL